MRQARTPARPALAVIGLAGMALAGMVLAGLAVAAPVLVGSLVSPPRTGVLARVDAAWHAVATPAARAGPVWRTTPWDAPPATTAARRTAGTAAPGYVPARRVLRYGTHGPDVRRLQQRLLQLGYFPGPRDGRFGPDTREAVWAFQEAQRLPVSGQVSGRANGALEHPRTPAPLVRNGGAQRVEVDLGARVLYVYHHNKIVLISHVSSGGGYYYCSVGSCSYAITPTGDFRTLWRVQGWHVAPLGLMYNPVFFDGGFAIHGDTDVPLTPVSHGCVRIPMDVASIFPGLVPREGIPVYIRH